MKKVLNIGAYILLLAYMAVSISFSSSKESELLCNKLEIKMIDTVYSGFLGRKDIEKIILREESNILGYPVSRINTRKIEEKIRSLSYIERAELYFDLEGVLHAKIIQRRPVLRIITRNNSSYYIDRNGFIFRPKGRFTPQVMICNGYFSEGDDVKKASSLEELRSLPRYKEWDEAWKLAMFIDEDEFWRSQLVQLYLNKDEEFEMIPRVGAHQILLGNTEELEEKFNNLMILYTEGLDYEGWNKYGKINLKYKNQVICTKR